MKKLKLLYLIYFVSSAYSTNVNCNSQKRTYDYQDHNTSMTNHFSKKLHLIKNNFGKKQNFNCDLFNNPVIYANNNSTIYSANECPVITFPEENTYNNISAPIITIIDDHASKNFSNNEQQNFPTEVSKEPNFIDIGKPIITLPE